MSKDINEKREKEKEIIKLMISIYCNGNKHLKSNKHNQGIKNCHGNNHTQDDIKLCPECRELLNYAIVRTDLCPFMETKTFCSNCKVHCYQPQMREEIKKVMRYSGPRLLLHHPILSIYHLLESKKEKRST